MKRQLTVALGLAVLATPVFASKARLQALGEDVNGSFYVNDNRNIFLNAAQVNNHKDLVTFEWGDTSNATDATGTPRAEGGVFRSHNNMVYGVQFGSESNTSNGYRAATMGANAVAEENNLDLFVGGDAGMKWGANVTYSKSAKDETDGDAEQSALRTRFGVITGDLEAYANVSLGNKAENGAAEFKGKLGYKVGAIYNMNDYRIFADYGSNSGENGATDDELSNSQIQIGAGRTSKLNDKASLFTRAQFTMVNAENDASPLDLGGSAGPVSCNAASPLACEEFKAMFIPVVVGLEYDAASWLVLRGSVQQTIWGSQEGKDSKSPFHDTTVVNAGATLKFGEMSVDGVIGNDAGSTATGQLNTDNLMSRVSMTYRF